MLTQQVDQFINHLAASHIYSHNTVLAYKNDLMQFTRFAGGARQAGLDGIMVKNYVEGLQNQGYAASTVARKVAALKTFLNFLRRTKATNVDLGAKIAIPKVQRSPQRRLSFEQISQLSQSLRETVVPKELRNRALLHLLYLTDIPLTQLTELKISDFDGQKLAGTELSSLALECLLDYLENGRPQLLRDPQETALFLNQRGGALTRQGMWLIIKECAEKAQLDVPVTPRLLRHTFDA